jgi:hypothetical protein
MAFMAAWRYCSTISGISDIARRLGLGYFPYEPSGISIFHLDDIGLSVDDIGAAPSGWYTGRWRYISKASTMETKDDMFRSINDIHAQI